MEMSGAQIIVETLIEQRCKTIFGYPGGQVLNIYDELYLHSDKINHVIAAHEQGAIHAADGYARTSGEVGVCIATSGPGATNIVTGIANAYLDSVPVVAITGNVPTTLLGRDSFQEVDIVGITLPVTKHNYMVKDVTKLAETIREAFKIAKSGRPGPVLIDVPKDIQIAKTEYTPNGVVEAYPDKFASDDEITRAAQLINEAKKPYIYCGGGVINGNAADEVNELSKLCDSPVGCSMMGLSAVPYSYEKNLGMMGMHGWYPSTKAMMEADVIVAIGVRFSDRATGDKSKFAQRAKIIHIDIDPAEIDKNITVYQGIIGNIKDALTRLNKLVISAKHGEWTKEVAAMQAHQAQFVKPCDDFTPKKIVDMVGEFADDDTQIATDVGQHQMWVAQYYKFEKPRTFITSGGLGTMGFGMGAAIGSCIAKDRKRTVLFTGDGSFGMNLNEMATAVSQNIPLVIVIIDNGVLGMVRQWQTRFFDKHYSSTTLNRATDFVKLAEAFGATGFRATNENELSDALTKAFATNSPVVIDCMIDKDMDVIPMIPPNKSIDNIILK